MAIGTLALVFVVPVFYIFFEYMQEKVRPPMHLDVDKQVAQERERSMSERSAFNKPEEK